LQAPGVALAFILQEILQNQAKALAGHRRAYTETTKKAEKICSVFPNLPSLFPLILAGISTIMYADFKSGACARSFDGKIAKTRQNPMEQGGYHFEQSNVIA